MLILLLKNKQTHPLNDTSLFKFIHSNTFQSSTSDSAALSTSVGSKSPSRRLSRVDFPSPLGPTIAT